VASGRGALEGLALKRDLPFAISSLSGPFDALFGGAYLGRRVLVTGHTGFKGSWLALWLQALGADVCGLALPAEPGRPNHLQLLGLAMEEALVDLRDAAAVAAAVQRFRPEVVFHLAAQPLVRRSYREPAATFDVNVMGLVHLLEAVRATPSVAAVVNATTDKCYLNRERTEGYREDDALGGHDPYSASKACAELVSASWRSSFLAARDARPPVALATARAGNVVGGGDWGEDRLVPDLVRSATTGSPVAIRYPNATRPWQHVLEPLAGYLTLGARLLADPAADAEAWNFGPDASGQLSVAQAIVAFARHWPKVRCDVDRAAQPHEAGLLHLDCSKAKERLGWRPVWNAATTFERTAAWYRRQVQEGAVDSRSDLERYVADARRAGLAWAAAERVAEAA
jgi:CDP-glucose 4,6-dehydratase